MPHHLPPFLGPMGLPLRPLRGLQETRVATREESGVLVLSCEGSRATPGAALGQP